jgi:hypothetical protein
LESNRNADWAEFDRLGELYYENQKKERGCDRGLEIIEFVPQFPCVRGIVPLGSDARDSVVDSHKFACGLHAISSAPIVYSFGSARNQLFETSLLKVRPDAKVFTFEIDPNGLPPIGSRLPSIEYFNIGLGYDKADANVKSRRDLMAMLGHSYVDVLKMDIEGFEWSFLENEASALRQVGQFLVEVHLHSAALMTHHAQSLGNARYLLETLESQGLRLFFKETNTNSPLPCEHPKFYTELSFIQKDWGVWDIEKKTL